MRDPVRVRLACADRAERTTVSRGLRDAADSDVSIGATDDREPAADCVVGVPASDPVAFTADLVGSVRCPVVIFGSAGGQPAEILSAGATDVVPREGGYDLLAQRVHSVIDRDRPVVLTDGSGSATTDRPQEPLERITDGFLTLTDDWAVTYANEAWGEIFDIDPDEAVGMAVWDVFPTQWRDSFERAVQTGEARSFETHGEWCDRWFEIRVYPDDDGLSVFVRDITTRREARQQLEASERSLQRLHELAADADATRSEKIEGMLAIGRERLGVDLGFLTRITDGTQEIVEVVGDHSDLQPGSTAPLSEAYCRHTLGRSEPLGVTDAAAEGWENDPAYERFGLACYLGATIYVDGEQYGTVCFAGTEPRATAFSESERTFVDLLTDWVSYLLEQRRYEQQIRANQRRLETITDHIPVVVFALDTDGRFTLTRGGGLDALGLDPGGDVGETIFERYADYPAIIDHFERARDGEKTQHSVALDDGTTLELWYRPVFENGEVQQVVGVVHDVSELAEHRMRLSGLLETTRSLMQARSREEVADLVAAAAQDVLGFHINVVRLYDADAGTLEPAATTAVAEEYMGQRPVYEVGEGFPGEVFATGEPLVIDDIETTDVETDIDVRSAMYYPVGVHGTISVGSTERAAFDETDQQVLALLATAAAAACTRAKREREVREAREHVETVLERVNGLIEDTIEVLVQATTREELETGVAQRLAGADPHTFAWIGRPDVASQTLSPTAWAGTASVSAETMELVLDDSGPIETALATGNPQIVDRGQEWADLLGCTDECAKTCIVVPLGYKDTDYGVLAVYADEAGTFDEREQVVLAALGRAVANAINAVERGRILDADKIIELEFAIDDRELLFGRLSRAEDCRIESAGMDYRDDGTVRLYLTADDADGERLAALADEDDDVTDVKLIADLEDGCLLEVTVEESLVGQLSEYGSVVREIVAEAGTTRVTVELPYEAQARELFDLVDDQYPGTQLVGYHERERPVQTRQEFRAALSDRFTDRQETAIRTAFLGGFFDWPREIDGNELAEAMDISRPTYHQHLRAAQRKVLEELFDR